MYLFGGGASASFVHYVTAGEGDSDDKYLSTHRDVDADHHTGAKSLPDMTLAMTRYVACVKPKDGAVLGFARVVYVHWLFSSSSAQCSEEARGGGCCGSGSVGSLARVALARIELHNCGATERPSSSNRVR